MRVEHVHGYQDRLGPRSNCGRVVAVLVGVVALSDAAPAALVLVPDAAYFDALPTGVSITSQTGISVIAAGDGAGFAPMLYKSGAWLVLPAGLLGCAPLTS